MVFIKKSSTLRADVLTFQWTEDALARSSNNRNNYTTIPQYVVLLTSQNEIWTSCYI